MPPKKRRSTSKSTAKRRASTTTPPPLPALAAGERYWVLDLPWGARFADVRYLNSIKAHLYVGAALPPHLSDYDTVPYTYLRMREDELNTSHGLPARTVERTMTVTPYPQQRDGARAIARSAAAGHPQYLLADDTGVGKTLTAVLAAKALLRLRGARRVLIVADRPAAITETSWANAISAAGDDNATWCIVTWGRLKKVYREPWDIIVADEAQALRHQTSKRWAMWTTMTGMNRASGTKPYLLMATATPGHDPSELGYLAPMFAHATGTHPRDWIGDDGKRLLDMLDRQGLHFPSGRYGRQWTDDPGEQRRDLAKVTAWMDGATIHRDAPWGPARIHAVPVRLDPAARAQYQQDWGAFCADMDLARRGNNVPKGRAAVVRLRQKASMLRAATTAEWAVAQVEAGKQVVVSVDHVTTGAEPIVEALSDLGAKVARIYGNPADTGRDAETERMLFQTGACPIVVTTKTAAINLEANQDLGGGRTATSAPRVGVMHQARYSGINGRQIIGRTHRNHQRSDWYVTYALDTIEEHVVKLMVERYRTATDMVGGDTSTLRQIATLLGATWLPSEALSDDPE